LQLVVTLSRHRPLPLLLTLLDPFAQVPPRVGGPALALFGRDLVFDPIKALARAHIEQATAALPFEQVAARPGQHPPGLLQRPGAVNQAPRGSVGRSGSNTSRTRCRRQRRWSGSESVTSQSPRAASPTPQPEARSQRPTKSRQTSASDGAGAGGLAAVPFVTTT